MLSEEIRGLVVQARRNVRNPNFLTHVFDRLDIAAAETPTRPTATGRACYPRGGSSC